MRGDVVLINYPFADGRGAKLRPALEAGRDGVSPVNVIVAQITGNIGRVGPTRLMVDPAEPNGAGSGLRQPSVVVCDMLYTFNRGLVRRELGRLSPSAMARMTIA